MSTLYCGLLTINPYNNKLLAIDKKSRLKDYCKHIRCLYPEEYKILDINDYISSMYNRSNINNIITGNNIIKFYDKLITNADYEILLNDIMLNIETIKSSLSSIDDMIYIYKDMILDYNELYKNLLNIKKEVNYSLYNNELYNKIAMAQKDASPLFSPNIDEYISYKEMVKDEKNILNRYYNLLNNRDD